ncbi:Pentatricopeptide repeat-containing protein [Thalictrum thalictroides]|uniref:Pentatricopeptide repeat-containing protein n=1 Tax=Thalictrum thalictroides TaxID=46969 RepID=A0A7J6WRL5_THATH|nr:Pentatricopeptide repeat-containing protein [Thalictrum thalictroides]
MRVLNRVLQIYSTSSSSSVTELTRNLSTLVDLFKVTTDPKPISKKNRTRSPLKERIKPSEAATSLYRSLSVLENTENESVDRVLNEWKSTQGISLNKDDILVSIDYLRSFNKFNLALQLLEWTEKRSLIWLSHREHAIYIVLLGKARGVEAAENYFADLPESAKRKSTYGALLHCYCSEKMTEKAIVICEKMHALNLPLNSFDYSSLMILHMKLGQPDKVPLLMKEMKEKGLKLHIYNYKLLINSYASLNDIDAVEKVEEEIKMVHSVIPEWDFFCNLAAIYVAAGLLEKAEMNLKKVEKLKLYDPKPFRFLLNLYASIGKPEEVYRVWQSLKSAFRKTNNLSYLTMLQVLSRLEDMDGLERCFEEWESHCLSYDVRLPNVLIKAYLKRDMIEEAKLLLDHTLKKGCEPNFATYVLFIDFFVKIHDMDLALNYMRVGSPYVRNTERRMYTKYASMFQKYFEERNDMDGAVEFNRLKQDADSLDLEVHDIDASLRDEVDAFSAKRLSTLFDYGMVSDEH